MLPSASIGFEAHSARPHPLRVAMRVLVVSKENFVALALCEELENEGHVAIGPARSSGEALLLSDSTRPHCAIVAEHLESTRAGVSLADRLRERHDVRVVMLTSDQMNEKETDAVKRERKGGRSNAKTIVQGLPRRTAMDLGD